jgi:hypothetical protein
MKEVICIRCNKKYSLPDFTQEPFKCCTAPPLHTQVLNLTKDLTNNLINGFKTSEELKKDRLQICEGCEFYKEKRCTQCGCFMELKTLLTSSACPLGKW